MVTCMCFRKILRTMEWALRRKGECKAKAKLGVDDIFIQQLNDHTHPPSPINIETHKVKVNITRKTNTTKDTCQKILRVELQNISATAAANLPELKDIKVSGNPCDDHNLTQ